MLGILSRIISLLFSVRLAQSVSLFRNDSEPLSKKLDRFVPDLAPFEEDVRVDPLGGLDTIRRAYIQRLFSGAFYEACIRKGFVVKPVYFWPGERVELPCRMCTRDKAYNGKIKHWSFIRQKFLKDFNRLDKFPKTAWTRLDENTARQFRPATEKRIYMPAFTPKAKPFMRLHNNRPNMTFVQRDGRLKILAAESNAYGLYRCFDDTDRDTVTLIYYLIPITPLFRMEYATIYRYECRSHVRYDRNEKYERFDGMHRFRVISPNFWNGSATANNFCPANWRNYNYSDVTFSPPPFDHDTVTSDVHVLHATDRRGKKNLQLNLKIFVHWSPWSECDSVRRYRTRQGYCHIGKMNPNMKYQPEEKEKSIIRARGLDFLMLIHKLIETVDEFRRYGIPLFSGVLAHLISGESGPPVAQCTDAIFLTEIEISKTFRDNYNWVWQLIVEPLIGKSYNKTYNNFRLEMFTAIAQNPCFYYNKSTTAVHLIYGYTLDQNENC